MPEPFGVLLIDGAVSTAADWWKGIIDEERVVGRLTACPGPREVFAALLAIQRGISPDDRRKTG
jgi:hypothetical protein